MIPEITIDKFTYELPDDRIARFPLAERDQSKLLLYRNGQIAEDIFSGIGNYLSASDTLVFNNTKVIHARLLFYKNTGACIEIFCLEPVDPITFEQVLACKNTCVWRCVVGNLKKWKSETLQLACNGITLHAEKLSTKNDAVTIRFTWNGGLTFGELMEQYGNVPIPPYLKRDTEELDNTRYQTVYSKHEGSVAAPTAGLHFTDNLLQQLSAKGIAIEELTLHVGAGTFKPVKTTYIAQHDMHSEHFRIELEMLKHIKTKAGSIIAVGTTSVRMLESLYWLGVNIGDGNLHVHQWQPYDKEENIPTEKALENICHYMESKGLTTLDASTQIMIVPSYRFRMIKGLISNFHQPQSTLLLLIAALVGDNWQAVYNYALQHNFRFLSYGDSSLLLP